MPLVFTGSIGEHAAQVSQHVCDGAACLGVSLDTALANAAHGPCITRAGSAVSASVVATDDEMIMRHSRRLLRPDPAIHAAGGPAPVRFR